MKKPIKRAIGIIIAVFVILLIVNIFRYLNKNLSYAIATKTTVEQAFSGEGVLIRNEKIIPVSGGVFEPAITPGTRISGRSLLGYLYKGTLDTETEKRLRELNDRIAQLSTDALFADSYRSSTPEELALDSAYDMIATINSGDFDRVSSFATNIELALNQQKEEGEETDLDQQLTQLRAEKMQIEEQISAVRESIYAPFGGILSENIDGYETVFPIEQLKTLTPSQLSETSSVKDSGDFVKVIDNSEWFLAMNVSESDARDMAVGTQVSLRLPELDETAVPATVYALNTEGNIVCLVLICSRTIPSVFDYRAVKAEIVTSSKIGYQLPSEALRMRDDQQGVFVVRDNLARFVPIEIVLQQDEYILVGTATENGIKLYDEVITTGNVEEGMLVR